MKKYSAKGFKYCKLDTEEVYNIANRRLEFDKGHMMTVINNLPNSDIEDLRWSSRLIEVLIKAFNLYCKVFKRPRAHKRTDV